MQRIKINVFRHLLFYLREFLGTQVFLGSTSLIHWVIKYLLVTTHLQCIMPVISSVQLLSCIRLFATWWTAARQASLSIMISRSLLKLMSIELVMPSNHLILYHPLLLPPSIFPTIRVFSNESALCIKWSKYWSFSFNIRPSNEYSRLISFRIDWFDLLALEGVIHQSIWGD